MTDFERFMKEFSSGFKLTLTQRRVGFTVEYSFSHYQVIAAFTYDFDFVEGGIRDSFRKGLSKDYAGDLTFFIHAIRYTKDYGTIPTKSKF